MPLTGITRRATSADATPLCAFTFRELLVQKRLAERAARRAPDNASASLLLQKIVAELEARRLNNVGHNPGTDLLP
ncbi:MAG: hypothetical protein AAGJ94_07115 [Pseudomonadota bacterium]